MLIKKIDNIKFIYCKRSANKMTDKIVKESLMYCNERLLVMDNFICLLFQ